MPRPRSFGLVATVLLLANSGAARGGESMPSDFVYLRDVDPSIQQDMRYAGPDNFTGGPVPGYQAPECILVGPAAKALKAVQADLRPKGLSLKVYDCYRPEQAVAAFVAWAKQPDDPAAKRSHYPTLPKSALFPDYIATRSGHSRGATLDVTLVPDGVRTTPDEAAASNASACGLHAPADGSLDMGTGFDCFSPKSNTVTSGLTPEQKRNRALLLDAMTRHGFKNYPQEIWHYTFEPEPHPARYFDFPVAPRPGGGQP
jgi:D-alanyl-D-alanine dipeptidase